MQGWQYFTSKNYSTNFYHGCDLWKEHRIKQEVQQTKDKVTWIWILHHCYKHLKTFLEFSNFSFVSLFSVVFSKNWKFDFITPFLRNGLIMVLQSYFNFVHFVENFKILHENVKTFYNFHCARSYAVQNDQRVV